MVTFFLALICRWFGAIGVEFRLAKAFYNSTDTLFDDNFDTESGWVTLLISEVELGEIFPFCTAARTCWVLLIPNKSCISISC